MLFVLRTKTAIGDTGFIWDKPLGITAVVTHTDLGGKKQEITLESNYLLPTSPLKSSDVVDLKDFKSWLLQSDRSDVEKRKKLQDKVIILKGEEQKPGRMIRFWSCFVPKREVWRALSESIGIPQPVDEESKPDGKSFHGFGAGFITSTKGMPTGITLQMKQGGNAGYIPNFFILIEDPALNFDIGRKSIPPRQQGMLRDLAQSQFREYLNSAIKYIAGTVYPEDSSWSRDEAFSAIEGFPDMQSSSTRFIKRPGGQEAMIAAMFFEQIGRGQFADLTLLASAYKDRYDLYALWNKHRCVIEFKFDLLGLLTNFDETTKMFNEIDVVIVWEITENDLKLAKKRAISVEAISESSLFKSKRFPLATKELRIGSVKPIYVVEMKNAVGID